MLKSIASKLTRSKSIPLTEDQIRRHKEQKRQRDEWSADVQAMQAIIDRLRTEYAKHKGDFAVGRYDELKSMVKSAIESFKANVALNRDHRQTGPRSAGGAAALRDQAADFARSQERIKADEKLYSDMSAAKLEEETERFRREVLQLKQDFRRVKERLEKLADEYEKSKELNVAQRYAVLKDMIKDVTVTNATA